MELKDVILSTLAEMQDNEEGKKILDSSTNSKIVKKVETLKQDKEFTAPKTDTNSSSSELVFLNSLKERLLVLFEGFASPSNTNIEAKVDMTMNFLEYALANIDERTSQIKSGDTK